MTATAELLPADETFLEQLRRVNMDRYLAWVGDSEDAGILFDAAELGGEVGELLNVVKKLVREAHGWRGSRATPQDFADECADVLICLDKLARRRNVDLEAATIAKFNATSEKQGFPHRLAAVAVKAGEGMREMIADIIAAKVSGPPLQEEIWKRAQRLDQLTAADAILAALAPPATDPVIKQSLTTDEAGELREACAKEAEKDYTPGYGPHNDAKECLAERVRLGIAERIRALPLPKVRATLAPATDPTVAALVERRAIARCIEIVREVREGFLSEEYATPQPLGSIQERFACDQVANAIEDEFAMGTIEQRKLLGKPTPVEEYRALPTEKAR